MLTAIFGTVVTDCWKAAVRRHVGKHHRGMHSSTIMDFADELAYALLTNGLRDQGRPSRTLVADPRLPLRTPCHGGIVQPSLATMVQQHTFRNDTTLKAWNGKRPQHRCRYCLVKYGVQSWITYYRSKCDVPLCAICHRGGRDCFEAHLLGGPEDFMPARYQPTMAAPQSTSAWNEHSLV